jgi:hypothetical protein
VGNRPGHSQDTCPKRPPLDLPLNLTQWFPQETILHWVHQAVDQALPELSAPSAPTRHLDDKGRSLAVLMTFAYATQIFRSKELVAACHTLPFLNSLCGDRAPFVQEIEHFRRANRPLLELALTQVLLSAMSSKVGFQREKADPELREDLRRRAEEWLDTARHMNTWDEFDTA